MTYGGSRRPDLAARLRRGQRALKNRLERPEFVLALLRAAHESLDPESIGKLVVTRAEEWFKASACGVFAADLDGQVAGLASKGIGESLSPAALGVARWVLGHGREFASADLRKDARAMGAAGAVLAWPLRCRAQTVAALVVMERQAAKQVPQLTPAVAEAFGAILQGPAQALDNALRLRRSEAISVTDDLTQLYNSRYLNQVLRREAKRASRSGRPLSLLFLDLDGQVAGLASKGIGESLSPAALGVARWVLGHGREFASADLRKDSRAMGAAGAVLAWPLRCRAQTVAALVVMDRQAATQLPQLSAAVAEAFATMLHGCLLYTSPSPRDS